MVFMMTCILTAHWCYLSTILSVIGLESIYANSVANHWCHSHVLVVILMLQNLMAEYFNNFTGALYWYSVLQTEGFSYCFHCLQWTLQTDLVFNLHLTQSQTVLNSAGISQMCYTWYIHTYIYILCGPYVYIC